MEFNFPGVVTEQHAAPLLSVTAKPVVHPVPHRPLALHLQAPLPAAPGPVLRNASSGLPGSVLCALDPSQPRHAACQSFKDNSHR